jgi:hypothetical protein
MRPKGGLADCCCAGVCAAAAALGQAGPPNLQPR